MVMNMIETLVQMLPTIAVVTIFTIATMMAVLCSKTEEGSPWVVLMLGIDVLCVSWVLHNLMF